jgi:hypothetical protein
MTPLRRWFGLAQVLLAFVLLAFVLEALGSDLQRVNGQSSDASRKIVLVAGETAKVDKVGHHDYIAGCTLCPRFMCRRLLPSRFPTLAIGLGDKRLSFVVIGDLQRL